MTNTFAESVPAPRLMAKPAQILTFPRNRTLHLTPREVERRFPGLTRMVLADRRARGLAPRFETVAGCAMYLFWDVAKYAADSSADAGSPAVAEPLRCTIYIRADSLFGPDDLGAYVERCEAYQKRQGWQHFTTTVDFGPSNRRRRLLGGFREILERAQNREFDVLLVPSTDHISKERSGARYFVQALAQSGVQVRDLEAPVCLIGYRIKE